MDRLTIIQRIKMTKTYYQNVDPATATYSASRIDCGLYGRLPAQTIRKIVKKFEKIGVATNLEMAVHLHFAHSAEYIAIVSNSVAEDPNVSIPHRSQELGLFYGTLSHILHLYLHLHPYKVYRYCQ